MTFSSRKKDPFFTPFESSINGYLFPDHFALMADNEPHPLCMVAALQLQDYLKHQEDWEHNFGLLHGQEGHVIGKMFGVLVVKNTDGEVGYLAAFSGKLAGGNNHAKFVPPVFDALTENSFLNNGMTALTRINEEIKALQTLKPEGYKESIALLKVKRRDHSNALQQALFNQYHFLNQAGEEKSLQNIFTAAGYKNPPSGAGECAGPKLLQYAFQHKMQPLAIAEFWWGLSPKSDLWEHGHFYPCCKEKCGPILGHMLEGIK